MLALVDAGAFVRMNVATAQNLTVPANATVAFPVGTVIHLEQAGVGITTIVAAAGVTIDSPAGLVFGARYQQATITQSATNVWELEFSIPAIVPAFSFKSIATIPTAPLSNGTRTMMGLAGAITPAALGRMRITIDGFFVFGSVTAGNGMGISVMYGTGTAPTNGAALTGTQPGQIMIAKNAAAATNVADTSVPFSITVVASGFVVGTTYWIDLAAEGIGSGTPGTIQNINISATEF